jgi:phosphoglycolate phosphatase-like HAD superfamily hydrolase
LFDIDGTLLSTGGAGRTAMAAAFADLFGGCDRVDDVPFSGRTDRVIARDLFAAHGVQDNPTNWTAFRSAYLERLPKALADSDGMVLPGVNPLLDRLEAFPNVALGLLTGNLHDGARLKLSHYGLYERFSFGGFGDVHVERNDVAREAFRVACDRLEHEVDPNEVWVIGDTPLDIACARAIGARVAAVATGFFTVEELAAFKPDLLLSDLGEAAAGSPLLPS